MGLDFSKVTPPASPTGEAGTEVETVKPYDIVADRKQMNETLVNSDEVDALVSTIEVNNLETIVCFGADAAEEVAKASDKMCIRDRHCTASVHRIQKQSDWY